MDGSALVEVARKCYTDDISVKVVTMHVGVLPSADISTQKLQCSNLSIGSRMRDTTGIQTVMY